MTVSQGNDSLTVSTGNHTITVSAGNSTITAGQSITLQVGANSMKIDTDGITMVGSKISIMAQESMSADGGLSMTLQAGRSRSTEQRHDGHRTNSPRCSNAMSVR